MSEAGYPKYCPFLPFTVLHPMVAARLELHTPIVEVVQKKAKYEPTLQHVKVYPVLLDGDGNFVDLVFLRIYSDRASEENTYTIGGFSRPTAQLLPKLDLVA